MAKILVVDDDRVLSGMVKDWLTHEQHTVTVANAGFEGWQQIQGNEYELAILDWDMPDINGIDVLKRYREAGGTTPVLMLTGRSTIDDKERGLDLGANDYLTKPFHMKELSARIRAILRNSATAAPPPPKPLGTPDKDLLQLGQLDGTTLAARYEFLEVVGEGGTAIVFKARHPQMDKLMAIKMLMSHVVGEELINRFQIEARAISRLDHPNIIAVHDFGVTERGLPFMVMDYIEGDSICTILEKRPYLPIEEGLPIMHQVSDGLAYAHEAGVLHRDIKPANIVLKQERNRAPLPKILDFGLAKLTADPQNVQHLTRPQAVMGTPLYMSPEQVKGMVVDQRSDIYALGCVIFETVTGEPPFLGDTPQQTMFMQVDKQPCSLKEMCPEVSYPQELQDFVSKAMQKDPANRYQSMRELHQELGKVLQKLQITAQ